MENAGGSHPEAHAGATAGSPSTPVQTRIKIFDRNVDRGPFHPSFITVPKTDMSDIIKLRLSLLEKFLQMDEYAEQWVNIRTAIALYHNPGSRNGPVTYIQNGNVVAIDDVQEGVHWIEVGDMFNK